VGMATGHSIQFVFNRHACSAVLTAHQTFSPNRTASLNSTAFSRFSCSTKLRARCVTRRRLHVTGIYFVYLSGPIRTPPPIAHIAAAHHRVGLVCVGPHCRRFSHIIGGMPIRYYDNVSSSIMQNMSSYYDIVMSASTTRTLPL
jgi:hypothetical protein